jgi:hypothetical protein
LGAVTQALLAIARDNSDDRVVASRICQACVVGLDIDGAAISLLTTGPGRQTLAVTDETAERGGGSVAGVRGGGRGTDRRPRPVRAAAAVG